MRANLFILGLIASAVLLGMRPTLRTLEAPSAAEMVVACGSNPNLKNCDNPMSCRACLCSNDEEGDVCKKCTYTKTYFRCGSEGTEQCSDFGATCACGSLMRFNEPCTSDNDCLNGCGGSGVLDGTCERQGCLAC